MDGAAAPLFEHFGERNCLIDGPAPLSPIGSGKPHGDGPLAREGSSHGLGHFEREADTVLQGAAIVAALSKQLRSKQFDGFASSNSIPRRPSAMMGNSDHGNIA